MKQQPKKDWDEIVPLWLSSHPESTQYVYGPVITDFRLAIGKKGISRVTFEDLQQYMARWSATQKPRTVNRKMATIKSLLRFAFRLGVMKHDVSRMCRVKAPPDTLAEKILTVEQIHSIIDNESSLKKKVLIRLLYATGIRVSEACGLRWKDVIERSKKEGQITVLGKGNKTRSIRISAKTMRDLQSIKPKSSKLDSPVFASQQGTKLSRMELSSWVRDAALRVGLEHVSAHWMRHGHATHALDAGATLPLIQSSLGHSSLATTNRYLHIRPGESSSAYIRL